MENKKFLNEERYQKNKKKITMVAILVLIIGLLVGGGLIATGISKQRKINSNYSQNSKAKLTKQLATEKQNLENSKATLEEKIKPIEDQIKSLDREEFTGIDDAYYERKDRIEELKKSIQADKKSIEIINDALDGECDFPSIKDNSYTSKYCSIENQLKDKTDSNKESDSFDLIPFYMFGGFIILVTIIISGIIYSTAKSREITAFYAQQQIPVAKEIIDEMAPTVGNSVGEIAKGIKKGLKDEEK